MQRGSQTYAEWLNECYQAKLQRTEPKARSAEFDRGNLERYIIPKLGTLPLLDIRPMHIQRCLDTIQVEIRKQIDPKTGKRRYEGTRTVQAVARLIEETLTLAYDRHLMPDNPYSGIKLPKYRRKKIEPMDDVQCQAFYDAARGALDVRPRYRDKRGRFKRLPAIDPRLLALWASYLLLGWRRGEGLGVKWSDIDWEKRAIRIERQVQRVDGREIVVSTPKTEDSVRTHPLTRLLLDLYRQRWEDAEAEHALKGVAWTGQGFIFPSSEGTPIWPDNLEGMFRRIRAAAGLPDTIKLHHLRHTLATLIDECGATEALKAGILGHSQKTQSGKYTHARIEAMRVVLQAVEDRLFGGSAAKEGTGT